jgi:hypothetical protein
MPQISQIPYSSGQRQKKPSIPTASEHHGSAVDITSHTPCPWIHFTWAVGFLLSQRAGVQPHTSVSQRPGVLPKVATCPHPLLAYFSMAKTLSPRALGRVPAPESNMFPSPSSAPVPCEFPSSGSDDVQFSQTDSI